MGEFIRSLAFVGMAVSATISLAVQKKDVQEWTPPKTTVAKELVEAGKFLLEHGMADPRGGKFAIVQFKVNTRYINGLNSCEKIGWVKESAGKMMMVDLTGMAQPIDSVVREIPVAEAVQKALELSEKGMLYDCPYNIYKGYVEGRQLTSDEQLYSNLLTDEAVALLLIDGDQKEAESLFAKRGPVVYDKGKAIRTGIPEPEARCRMLERFVQRTLSAAVGAHVAKDDERAEASTRVLVDNEEAYRSYLLSLGQVPSIRRDELTGELLVLRMLDQAAILHQQSLQLVKEGSRKPDWAAFDKLPQKERIKQLVALLDEVGPNLVVGSLIGYGMDPVFDRLVKEDLAAGDALADCITNDKRFTRTDRMRNSGCPTDGLVKVKTVAKMVLELIVKHNGNDEYDIEPDGDARLVAYWNEVKHLTPTERWIKILRNAKAQPIQWIRASRWLTDSEKDETSTVKSFDPSKPLPPARFQSLSKSRKAELADLFLTRSKQIVDRKYAEPASSVYANSQRLVLAIAAYKIDRRKAARDLKELTNTLYNDRSLFEKGMYGPQADLAKGLGLLIEAKDQSAAKSYLAWLKEPIADAVYTPELFVPLLYLSPRVAESAVKEMLTNPKSAMFINPEDSWEQSSLAASMVKSPLLYFPSFRTLYAKLLADTTVVGNIKIDEKARYLTIVGLPNPLTLSCGTVDPNELPNIQGAVCRVCDYYAYQLAVNGAPEFKIYWPTKRKDEAIMKLIGYLKEHYSDLAMEAQRYRVWQL